MVSAELQETNPIPPPSGLHLFRFGDPERDRLVRLSLEGGNLSRDLSVSQSRAFELMDEYTPHKANLDRVLDEKTELVLQYSSFRTASAAYLMILDELSAKGVSSGEATNVFLKCFAIAAEYYERHTPRGTNKEQSLGGSISRYNAGNPEMTPIIKKIAGEPPSWFNRSKREWESFIEGHSYFQLILGTKVGLIEHISNSGYVSWDFTPDWMDDIKETVPKREEVEQELAEDSNEIAQVSDYMNRIAEQQSKLYGLYGKRFLKMTTNLEMRRRRLFSTDPSFPHFLIYLSATDSMHEYPIDLTRTAEMGIDFVRSSRVDPDKSREKSIASFSGQPISIEIMALWIERQFREANLRASSLIDGSLIPKLTLFSPDRERELRDSRGTDKKFFRLYNYQLKPFFALLTEDEKTYLTELIHVSQGETLEPVIWEMAHLFSSRRGTGIDFDKAEREIRRFSKSWLKNNWRLAYGELERVIKHPSEAIQPEVLSDRGFDEEDDTRRDYEIASRLANEGSVAGWDIFYTANMRGQKGGNLLRVGGETKDQRQDELGRVLLQDGTQVSIKNSSIINALDWITTIPAEILERWPEKIVNGEAFKKFKRGAVRILAQVDPENHRVVFFLHQKKAWSYGF